MKKINNVLLLGLLLIVISCGKDNLQPVNTQDNAKLSFADMFNSGDDLQALANTPYLTSYAIINPRSSVVTFFSDPDDFNCSDLPTEDFEEGPENLAFYPNPLNEFSDNIAFSPGDILPGVSMYSSSEDPVDEDLVIITPSWGAISKMVGPNNLLDSFVISFSAEGITCVSLDIFNFFSSTPVIVHVFGTSGLLGATSVPASTGGVYLGIRSSEPITMITLWSPTVAGEIIDNLAFGACHMIIDGCDTGVPDYTFPDGDTMLGLIMECAANANNHGGFVNCVSHLTNTWKKDGLITGDQKEAIMDCVGAADLP